ncbi:MAG: DUF2236 domain-containing protein [Anaerolineae bacterium]|nr:DUF2236 domain-containing protein [Anaerolineae bacterium]
MRGVFSHHYHALDPDLLFWVYATLVDSLMFIHKEILPPLGDDNWEVFYEEGKLFAYLFGVPDEIIPPTLGAFHRYVAGMLETLEITKTARDMAKAVIHSPHPVFGVSNSVLAAGTLPPRLREAFNLPWYFPVRAGYTVGMGILRVAVPRIPVRFLLHSPRDEFDPLSKIKTQILRRFSHES